MSSHVCRHFRPKLKRALHMKTGRILGKVVDIAMSRHLQTITNLARSSEYVFIHKKLIKKCCRVLVVRDQFSLQFFVGIRFHWGEQFSSLTIIILGEEVLRRLVPRATKPDTDREAVEKAAKAEAADEVRFPLSKQFLISFSSQNVELSVLQIIRKLLASIHLEKFCTTNENQICLYWSNSRAQ